jgi:succinate dehydrogenase flavin-adding protein (antitoxin of CptAB toxin-antitoxin module)
MMVQNILFGDVEIINIKTKQRETVKGLVFKEYDKPTDNDLVKYVLKRKPKPDRKNYRIFRVCRESAKIVGVTNP